jgi:hypothetical protein
MIIPDATAAWFADCFNRELADDIATKLTCWETGALADLLTALGRPDHAAVWLDAHADGDDEGDAHYRP